MDRCPGGVLDGHKGEGVVALRALIITQRTARAGRSAIDALVGGCGSGREGGGGGGGSDGAAGGEGGAREQGVWRCTLTTPHDHGEEEEVEDDTRPARSVLGRQAFHLAVVGGRRAAAAAVGSLDRSFFF